MKKFINTSLILVVIIASFTTSAFAGIKVVYTQDFNKAKELLVKARQVSGNKAQYVELIRKHLKKANATPEEIGTSEKELENFKKASVKL